MENSAAEQFIEQYMPAFRKYTLRTIPNGAVAEDALQEALIKMWLHYDQATDNPKSWAYSILRNAAYDTLRREKRRSHENIMDESHKGEIRNDARLVVLMDGCAQLIKEEEDEVITKAMNKLSAPEYRLVLGYMNGKSYKELADETQSRVSVVRGVLFRARERLRKSLVELVA